MNAKYFKITLGLALSLLPGAGLRADYDYGNMTQAEIAAEIEAVYAEVESAYDEIEAWQDLIAEREAEMEELQAEQNNANNVLAELADSRDEMENQMAEIGQSIEEYQSQYDGLMSNLDDLYYQEIECWDAISELAGMQDDLWNELSGLEEIMWEMEMEGFYPDDDECDWGDTYAGLMIQSCDTYNQIQDIEWELEVYNYVYAEIAEAIYSSQQEASALDQALYDLEDGLLEYENMLYLINSEEEALLWLVDELVYQIGLIQSDIANIESEVLGLENSIATKEAILEELFALYDLLGAGGG
jgi:chromosome segregation ATPase